jgi:LytS/YehU family sensor histidine kinase
MKIGNRTYWACQICGWATYSALGIWTATLENGWRPTIILGYLLFFLYSVGLTHLLRREAQRKQWTTLAIPAALLRFIPTAIATGAIQSALVVGVYRVLEGRLGIWSTPSAIVYMFLGLSSIDVIWSILYLTITAQRRAREAARTELRMKLALSEAELRALEAQINPHFLFNCLNSIRGMIGEDPSRAQDMVTRLAGMLRYNLQSERSRTVPLSSELDAVADYLALESVRFEERLRVHLVVDQPARDHAIPCLLLQTLVENAIKHGLEDLPSGGDLRIGAALDSGRLRIEVENTGRISQPQAGDTHIGLANARERLRLIYGDRASLDLAARGEDRVVATLLIPRNA